MDKVLPVVREGLQFYWFTSALGAGKLLPRMEFWRYVEYPLVHRALDLGDGYQILDIGSGYSIFPLYLAATRRYRVYITDNEAYHPGALRFHHSKIKDRLHLGRDLRARRIVVEHQDARCLGYADASFDRVTCISVLASIPGTGDSEAMAEIGRVLRPGGRVALTIPYSDRYEERSCSPWMEHFERSYNGAAIEDRLVRPSGLLEMARVFFGESAIRISRLYHRDIPRPVRLAVQTLTPLAGALFMWTGGEPRNGTGGAMLVLEKSTGSPLREDR